MTPHRPSRWLAPLALLAAIAAVGLVISGSMGDDGGDGDSSDASQQQQRGNGTTGEREQTSGDDAAETGLVVNLKKGQFLAPHDMRIRRHHRVVAGSRAPGKGWAPARALQ